MARFGDSSSTRVEATEESPRGPRTRERLGVVGLEERLAALGRLDGREALGVVHEERRAVLEEVGGALGAAPGDLREAAHQRPAYTVEKGATNASCPLDACRGFQPPFPV